MSQDLPPAAPSPLPPGAREAGAGGARAHFIQRLLARLAPLSRLPLWARFGASAVLVLACFALRVALDGVPPVQAPFLPFVPAVVAASLLFDRGSGFFATGLSAVLGLYFFIEPIHSLDDIGAGTVATLAIFLAVGLFSAAVVETLRHVVDELAASREALARDIDEHRRTEAALRASEARLRSVVETALDGVLVAAADGRIIAANPAAARMFGYDAAEALVGRNLSVLMPPHNAGRHDAYLAAHHATGRSRAIGVPGRELFARRRDGTEFPIDLSVASFEAGGERFFTGVVRDATERVRAERRREMLVAELNHRVKNTLATVQSIAVQTLRGARGDVSRFAHDFGARLRALAAAHDLLSAHAWAETDLAEVVRVGLAPWTGGDGPRIAPEGPEGAVPLRPLQAQALVLALHELATNAVKHGALSRAGGQVALRWSGRGPNGAVALEWVEAGGPRLAGAPARRGFGTRLLERAVAQDLGPGAAVELRFEPGGLRAAIRFFPPPSPPAASTVAMQAR